MNTCCGASVLKPINDMRGKAAQTIVQCAKKTLKLQGKELVHWLQLFLGVPEAVLTPTDRVETRRGYYPEPAVPNRHPRTTLVKHVGSPAGVVDGCNGGMGEPRERVDLALEEMDLMLGDVRTAPDHLESYLSMGLLLLDLVNRTHSALSNESEGPVAGDLG